jgi:hypothetical protein
MVREVINVLVVDENCGHYLDMTSDQLQMIVDLTDLWVPTLLLMAVRAFELEKEMIL